MPPWRFGGSSTLSVFRRGVDIDAERLGRQSSSIGFFFAFMILGSEA